MKKEFEVLPPNSMPNFVMIKTGSENCDSLAEPTKFDISGFSREEAEEFAELMKWTFMEHWEKRKNKIIESNTNIRGVY